LQKEYNLLLEPVCNIARDAGVAIMDIYATNFSSERKADGSLVTKADTAAETIILSALASLTPDIQIVSEARSAIGDFPDITGGTFWSVDPLDGTREFVKRNDEFTVNIGLIIDLKPVLGVLYAPALDILFFGAGFGSAKRVINSNKHSDIKCRKIPTEGIDVLVSRSHSRNEHLEDFLTNQKVNGYIPCGSALKFGLLAAGEADIYPRFGPTSEWDTAAGHAILEAAGGYIETLDGKPLVYGKYENKFLNPSFISHGKDNL
jgi:3'(2'), 5'-bisphosphate nucleotidase